MAVALTTSTLFAQVPSYVPTNGLVGYWPFNGNANDESGNGNNGTNNGATLTTDRFGNTNSAYNFDGINDNIGLGNFFNYTSFSISMWVKPGNQNGHAVIIDNNHASSNNWVFQTISNFSNNGYNFINSNEVLLSTNNWNHVILSYSLGVVRVYLNGNLVTETPWSLNYNNSPSLFLGYWQAANARFWKGDMDDIGIWNRALTQQEITNIFNSSLPQTACLPANVPTTGLVGYWPFCGNANDESGNGNNGTNNGAALTTDRFGNTNSAYNFSGGSSVNVPMTLLLHNLPVRTFSCWFNANGAQNGGRIYETTYLNGGIGMYNGNVLDAWYSNGTYECNVTNINAGNLNEWHNLVYVTDSNTGLGSIYLDGVFIASRNGLLSTSPSNWLNNFLRFGLGAQGESFIGKIDDIGIWNRALTPQEITNLYNVNQCITNITVTDTLIINVGQLSFNDPVTWANNITIAPNPASSQININFNNITNLNGGTLKIINSLGQEVATTPITTSGTNSTMQLATWGGTGMYFVQIINPQGQIVDIKKIILQ